MRKISVITTGGTIGSYLAKDLVWLDSAELQISNEINKVKEKLGCEIVTDSALNKHSEDIFPSDWAKILSSIKAANDSDSDGVIVTHGTDSLSFTVAAALCFRNMWTKKICFTGAYYAPNHPNSDAQLNLAASLEFVLNSNSSYKNGVFVAFRADGENKQARIIRGESLKPMNYDDEYFKSAYNEKVADYLLGNDASGTSIVFSENVCESKNPCLDSDKLPQADSIKLACSKVAMITLYPGIDKKFLAAAIAGREILIIQAYHCGTGPVFDSDLLSFIQESSSSVKILFGTFPQKYLKVPYESTEKLKNAGTFIYADVQAYFLYVFAVLGLSVGLTPDKLIDKLSPYQIPNKFLSL